MIFGDATLGKAEIVGFFANLKKEEYWVQGSPLPKEA